MEDALQAAYTKGLNEKIKDELVSHDDPPDLYSLISLCNRLDNRLRCQWHKQTRPSSRYKSPPFPVQHTSPNVPSAQVFYST